MGYYIEWGDYKNVSGIILERVNKSMFNKGLLIREEITDKKFNEEFTEKHNEIKAWGTENLKGMWTMVHAGVKEGVNSTVIGHKTSFIYFEPEEDCMGFKLTWL